MAISTKLLRPARRPQYQCLYQSSRLRLEAYRNARQFSSTSIVQAATGTYRREDKRAARGALAPKLEQAKAFTQTQMIPTDLGLVPQTFVRPTGLNLPSLTQDFKERMSMEWFQLRARFYNMYTSLHYKWFIRPSGSKKTHGKIVLNYPFSTRKIVSEAEQMHKKMYSAFAAGDVQTLSGMCADGLLASFRNRLSRRQAGDKLEWHCEILSKPKLVSHRATILPYKGPDGTSVGVRQAVIRLHTRQSLRRINTQTQTSKANKNEELVKSDGKLEITEYFVIQRRLWKKQEEPWQVWGMTEETTVSNLHEMQEEMKLIKGAKREQSMAGLMKNTGIKA